jgi:hypothetical protein
MNKARELLKKTNEASTSDLLKAARRATAMPPSRTKSMAQLAKEQTYGSRKPRSGYKPTGPTQKMGGYTPPPQAPLRPGYVPPSGGPVWYEPEPGLKAQAQATAGAAYKAGLGKAAAASARMRQIGQRGVQNQAQWAVKTDKARQQAARKWVKSTGKKGWSAQKELEAEIASRAAMPPKPTKAELERMKLFKQIKTGKASAEFGRGRRAVNWLRSKTTAREGSFLTKPMSTLWRGPDASRRMQSMERILKRLPNTPEYVDLKNQFKALQAERNSTLKNFVKEQKRMLAKIEKERDADVKALKSGAKKAAKEAENRVLQAAKGAAKEASERARAVELARARRSKTNFDRALENEKVALKSGKVQHIIQKEADLADMIRRATGISVESKSAAFLDVTDGMILNERKTTIQRTKRQIESNDYEDDRKSKIKRVAGKVRIGIKKAYHSRPAQFAKQRIRQDFVQDKLLR